MAKNKTAQTSKSVSDYIDAIDDEKKRDDCHALIKMFRDLSGFDAAMWGPSIVGFGTYHYKYESGHEGDMPLACFSPRKTSLVVYLPSDPDKKEALLKRLGKFKGSKGCIYIKRLADVDIEVLKKLITLSIKHNIKTHAV